MKPKPRLLYVGDLAPAPGQGGQIILNRHLRRLSVEWALDLVTPPRDCEDGPWTHLPLPRRRWWWPPFRPQRPGLVRLRSLAWRAELRALRRPHAMLTVLGGPLSWLAADLASYWSCPLLVIVHDHWRENGGLDDALVATHACRGASHLFAVSAEMQAVLHQEFPATPCTVLPPMPATRTLPWAEWRDSYATKPVFVHAGALHAYHVPFLARVARVLEQQGGNLLVICPSDNSALSDLRAQVDHVRHQPFLADNQDALRFITSHATALVVMYPFDTGAGGLPPTGFPSRFVEYVQLGLPVLIAAPPRNPVRSWALRHDWPLQLDPDDQAGLETVCSRISTRDGWEGAASAARRAAAGEFDPSRIHAQLTTKLPPADGLSPFSP